MNSSSTENSVTAQAGINIALVKYWGKRDPFANLPAVGSISLTLDTFVTTTTVCFDDGLDRDHFVLNEAARDDERVTHLLDQIRKTARVEHFARVTSVNTVPTASGLASSASGTAALALAAWHAAGLSGDKLAENPTFLDMVRKGSGSAPRSLLGGLVELDKETGGVQCLNQMDDWPLRMVVARLSREEKSVSSRDGMARTRATSPYFGAWVQNHPTDLADARNAIARRDLTRLGSVMERSTMRMHACMMASDPPLRYLKGTTLTVMDRVESLRDEGIGAWYTMDAGPHVKILCHADDAPTVVNALADYVPSNDLTIARPGPGAHLVES